MELPEHRDRYGLGFNKKLKDYSKKLHFSIPFKNMYFFNMKNFEGIPEVKKNQYIDSVDAEGSGSNGVVYNLKYIKEDGFIPTGSTYVAKELFENMSDTYKQNVMKEAFYHYIMHSILPECTPKIYGMVCEEYIDIEEPFRMLLLFQKIDGILVSEYCKDKSKKTDASLDQEKTNIIKQLFKFNWIKNLVFINHGDLHEENMMIDSKTKQLYIIDYGLSSLNLEKDEMITTYSNWRVIPDDEFGSDTYKIVYILKEFFKERGDLLKQEFGRQIEILEEKDKPNNSDWLRLLDKFYTVNELRIFIFGIIQIPVPTPLLEHAFGFPFDSTMFEKIDTDLELIMFITKYFTILYKLKDDRYNNNVDELEDYYDITLLLVTCKSTVDSAIIFSFGIDLYFAQFEYSLKVEGIDISYPKETSIELANEICLFKKTKFNYDFKHLKNKSIKSIFVYFKKASLQFFNRFLGKIKINDIVIEYDSSSDDIAHIPKEDENGLIFNSMARFIEKVFQNVEYLDEDIDYIKDFGLESLNPKVNYLLRIWNGHLFYSLIRFNKNKKLEFQLL